MPAIHDDTDEVNIGALLKEEDPEPEARPSKRDRRKDHDNDGEEEEDVDDDDEGEDDEDDGDGDDDDDDGEGGEEEEDENDDDDDEEDEEDEEAVAAEDGDEAAADEDDEDEDGEDEDFADSSKPKRSRRVAAAKPKAKPGAKPKPKGKAKASSSASSAGRSSKVKTLKPVQRLEAAMKAFKWWEAPPRAKGVRWSSLEHAGVLFAAPYEPHGVKVRYDGEPVALTPQQEEAATFFAACHNAQQLQRDESASTFKANFFRDWRRLLGPGHAIQDMDKVDFEPIVKHLERNREIRLARTKEEKDVVKAQKDLLQLKYGFALVDGHLQKMGNFNIEPPSLFRGRGEHPKAGTIKGRVMPERIQINCSYDAVVPACPLPGHAWARVVHDPRVTWIAGWHENVMGDNKYVYLAASSSFKGESDKSKYEKARRLRRFIDKIRAHYTAALSSKDEFQRQVGTAMWVIDRLALRVGGEKDEDEADTVGCCSVRVQHIAFVEDVPEAEVEEARRQLDELEAKRTRGDVVVDADEIEMSAAAAVVKGIKLGVTMDFLGKDSMRYFNTVDLGRYGPTGERVYKNLRRLVRGKKPEEDVFDLLTPTNLNKELQALMPGLSAKVFRTYNASLTLEQELPMIPPELSMDEKLVEYNRANKEVAILCNHQRSVGKAFVATMGKMQAKLAEMQSQIKDLEVWHKAVKAGKKVPLKDTSKPHHALKTADLTPEQKEKRAAEAHMFTKPPTTTQVLDRLKQFNMRYEKQKLRVKMKDENSTVALNTSKINYMDPRITVAWCKRVELPIEKVFARALQDKFPWAMGETMRYRF